MRNFKPDKLTIHVVSPEHAVNYKWEKEWPKVSKDLELISADELNSLPESIRKKYFDVSTFEEGMILILDRVNDRYYPANTAVDMIPQNRDRAIDHIASLLGAKSIERKVVSSELKKRKVDVNGEMVIGPVNLNSSYSESEKQRAERKYTGTKRFEGIRSIEGYKEAYDYCQKTGLIHDPSIRRMLEDRNPDHPNPILSESYNVTLTNEVENAVEAAFSLSYLKCFSVSANVKEVISTSREISLSLIIEYGK